VADARKIKGVRLSIPRTFGAEAIVWVQLDDDPAFVQLFSYFADEIGFTTNELMGKTVEQARELRHKKDVAYLQS
jgi:hypothetical protein